MYDILVNQAPPTPYSDLNVALMKLVESIREVASDNFVGAYLQGSFAVGDFDVHSDCDFIVVTDHELSPAEVESLQQVHEHVYSLDSPWAKHLEGSYFPARVLKSGSASGTDLWYLNHGSRSLERSAHCNTLVVRSVVRERGVTLQGPPPQTLVDPVPVDALRKEILSTMRDWGSEILKSPEHFNNRFYQTFIVLSYCRMLHDLITGYIGSKRAGAEWAKRNLDPSWASLIDRSWDGRPDPATSSRQPADPKDFQSTLVFVQYVIDKANALPAAAP
ncbi:MAG: aminoglycoside adenylyltransferase domain-containing protein [Chloroflexota bacterium]